MRLRLQAILNTYDDVDMAYSSEIIDLSPEPLRDTLRDASLRGRSQTDSKFNYLLLITAKILLKILNKNASLSIRNLCRR